MGAWGTKALENDTALDTIEDFVNASDHPAFVECLLDDFDENKILLGVALVDAAVNCSTREIFGERHEYKGFLYDMSNHSEDYEYLRRRALDRLSELTTDNWIDSCKTDRQKLYDGLKKRLEV